MTARPHVRRYSRVLLVDDEPLLLTAMQRALRREPFSLFTATSGSEALLVLEREAIDAVVSDQDMPNMTGVELFSVVSRRHPSTVRFMLTGKATLGLAMDAINRGSIQRFFTKPMEPDTLARSLKEALAQRALVAEAWKLVNRAREQSALLESLERRQPGITHLERDASGAILLDEAHQDLETLLDEISSVLGTAPTRDAA